MISITSSYLHCACYPWLLCVLPSWVKKTERLCNTNVLMNAQMPRR